jgi:protein-L-isoaspartate(D-aspartate) O-methyltransferase
MVDFALAREHMVANQLRTSGVSDWRVLKHFGNLPREIFVPEHRRMLAYLDEVHWFGQPGQSRFMAPPALLGRLLQLADVGPGQVVLHVGATTGYATAVLAGLAASVTALEMDPALSERARANLGRLGLDNATVVTGDLSALGKDQFEVILFEGALEEVPNRAVDLLADGGRLVAVIAGPRIGVARVLQRNGRDVAGRSEFDAALPLLFGARQSEEFEF